MGKFLYWKGGGHEHWFYPGHGMRKIFKRGKHVFDGHMLTSTDPNKALQTHGTIITSLITN